MGFYHAAAILAIENRFRTPSLELKYMGTSFCGQNKRFQSLGTQHGRRVIKARDDDDDDDDDDDRDDDEDDDDDDCERIMIMMMMMMTTTTVLMICCRFIKFIFRISVIKF